MSIRTDSIAVDFYFKSKQWRRWLGRWGNGWTIALGPLRLLWHFPPLGGWRSADTQSSKAPE